MEIIVKKIRTVQMHSIVYSFTLFFAISFCNEMKGMLSRTGILRPEAKAIREAARKKYSSLLQQSKTSKHPFEKEQLIKKHYADISQQLRFIESQLNYNEFFVYEKGTAQGTKVDKDVLKLSSFFKNMFGDIDKVTTKLIALPNPEWGSFTFKTIEATFYILDHIYKRKLTEEEIKKNLIRQAMKSESTDKEINITAEEAKIETKKAIQEDQILQAQMQKRSTDELIKITELINYLECDPIIENVYFSAVKNRTDKGQEKVIHALSTIKNPAIWKQLLLNPTILSYIKGLMMQYNMTHIKEDYLGWGSFSDQIISALAFSPDNKSLAVGRDIGFNACSLFDIETKTMKAGINLQRTYPTSRIISISFDKNGNNILAAPFAGELFLWTLDNSIFEQKNYLGGDEHIAKAIFNPTNNNEVLICREYYQGHNLQLFDVTQDSFQLRHNFANESIMDIAFSPDGTQFVSASWQDNIISLWDKEKKSLINSWKCESNLRSNAIKSIAFNNDGKKIIAAYIKNAEIGQHGRIEYADTNLCIIDIINPNEPIKKDFPLLRNKKNAGLSFFLTKDDKIIAWDSLGSMFLITLDDNGITNEIQIRQAPSTWSLNSSSIFSLALSSDEKKLAGGGKDTFARENYVHLWTTLTDSDTTILKNLQTLQDSHFISNQDTYKLIYQFWLNSRKGIAPSHYKMDAKEQSIYDSLPKEIKRLFLNN